MIRVIRILRARLTFSNVIAMSALFIALGGAAYAATQLPKNSVGTQQLKKGAVTKAKIKPATVDALRGATGPAGPAGAPGQPGPAGGTLPAGVTLRGALGFGRVEDVTTGGSPIAAQTNVSFGCYALSSRPVINIVVQEQFPAVPAPPACPGTKANPQATPGNLCVYVEVSPNLGGQFTVLDPTITSKPAITLNVDTKAFSLAGDGRASRFGFTAVRSVNVTGGASAFGSWAVTG
jgi:hypothetical protein